MLSLSVTIFIVVICCPAQILTAARDAPGNAPLSSPCHHDPVDVDITWLFDFIEEIAPNSAVDTLPHLVGK